MYYKYSLCTRRLDEYFCITYLSGMENTESIMSKRTRVGRPPMAEDQQQVLVPVRFPPELLDRIDEERSSRLSRPSRSAIIRELVETGLGRKRK
jgi:hypothetical protein